MQPRNEKLNIMVALQWANQEHTESSPVEEQPKCSWKQNGKQNMLRRINTSCYIENHSNICWSRHHSAWCWCAYDFWICMLQVLIMRMRKVLVKILLWHYEKTTKKQVQYLKCMIVLEKIVKCLPCTCKHVCMCSWWHWNICWEPGLGGHVASMQGLHSPTV